MSERRFIVDRFVSSDQVEIYVVHEVPLIPGAAPNFIQVCVGAVALSEFFNGLKEN